MGEDLELFCKFSAIALVVFVLYILRYMLFGDMIVRAQYPPPKVTRMATQVINTKDDPVQVELDQPYRFKAYIWGTKYPMEAQASYSISGLTVAKNHIIVAKKTNFFLRNVYTDAFDDISPVDIGMTWGDLDDKKTVQKYFNFQSRNFQTVGRQLNPKVKGCYNMIGICLFNKYHDFQYLGTHMAHTHTIPASENILSTLLSIKKWDIVRLDGYLVDVSDATGRKFAMTSMSRDDSNTKSRGWGQGGGACEVMYVTQIQIGDKIYE